MKEVKKTSAKSAAPKAVAKKAAPKVAAKAPAVPKAPAEKKAPATKKPVAAKKSSPTPEERYRMIQDAAYFVAERHGFNGDSAYFWSLAEAEINSNLG